MLFCLVYLQGRTYPGVMVLVDYAVDQPLAVQEGRAATGGVAQSEVGMLRMCKREVQPDCLATRSPDVSAAAGCGAVRHSMAAAAGAQGEMYIS